jgi:ABC-type multidrug transport system fused ATPase/permease subunit
LLRAVDIFSASSNSPLFGIDILDYFAAQLTPIALTLSPALQLWIKVALLAASYLFLQVLLFLASSKQSMTIGAVGIKATQQIRSDLFTHLQELDMSYHDRNEVGRTMSRITSDVEAIREFLGGAIVENILNLFTIAAVVVLILTLDVVLALVSFSLIPLVIFVSSIAKRFSRTRRKEVRRSNAMLMAYLGESISGIKVTKSSNREEKNEEQFAVLNTNRKQVQVRANTINITFFSILLFFSSLGAALLAFVGGIRTIEGYITIGTMLAFLNLNTIMFRPITILANFYEQLQDALTGAERIFALLNIKTRTPWNQRLEPVPIIKGEIIFKNVTFSYVPAIPILRNFTLSIPAGKKTALVGHTGAGKSTICNLLARMYDPQQGTILIDGIDIRQVSLFSYRQQIAVVPQDFFLFSFSIRENLRLGNPKATEEEMWDALKRVGLHDYIQRLDQGLDTPIQERGGRLSVGQRQLIVFAAVLLARPRIVILDEATSSVDVFTEILLQNAIKEVLKDRTAVIIAHRLTTIRDADLIIVMEDGKIVEQGTHEQLLDNNGIYYSLVKNQIELSEAIL